MPNDTSTSPSSWYNDPVVKQILNLHGDIFACRDMGPDSPKNRTETVADSLAHWSDPAQTLIFLDWDDTLFPSTDLFDRWGIPSRPELWDDLELTDKQEHDLMQWQQALSLYLRTACSLSERCVIVTNAKVGWVDDCLARFAPGLRDIFSRNEGLHVVYAQEALRARRLCPGTSRGSPALYSDTKISEEERLSDSISALTNAKYYAMRREAKQFYSQYPEQTWKNILSIGDASYEYDAAKDLAYRRRSPAGERLRFKTMVTPTCPMICDLTYRLRLATILWPAYVKFDGDLDLDMNCPDGLQAIANALDMPELRAWIRPLPGQWLDDTALEDDLDEVTIIVQNHIVE